MPMSHEARKKASEIRFNDSTFADWTCCKTPYEPPHYVSTSGSMYWFFKKGKRFMVIRRSDHWGQVSSCYWVVGGNPCNHWVTARCYIHRFVLPKTVGCN